MRCDSMNVAVKIDGCSAGRFVGDGTFCLVGCEDWRCFCYYYKIV